MSTRPQTILVVDEDESSRERLSESLKRDYRIVRAASGEAALSMLMREEVGVAIVDVSLPGISGFEMLPILRENYPSMAVIMLSAVAGVEHAVLAVKQGAHDFLSKPVDADLLRLSVTAAVERQALDREVLRLRAEVDDTERKFIVGPSPATRNVLGLVQRVAGLSATVLILGESGTGKELLARMIHAESERPGGPFVAVNLPAIPRDLVESTLFGHEKGSFTGAVRQQIGKFELAAGGSLFLDEIGDLRSELQAKLLRAIQENEIERIGGQRPIKTDFRLIAATNVDLERAVKEGRFREDLFYRLNVIPIKMPPLRERTEDIPELARFFLARYNRRFRKEITSIAETTIKMLQAYWWPGNIRELENLIERLVAISDRQVLTDEDLPLDFVFAQLDQNPKPTISLWDDATQAFERNFIIRALQKNRWNKTATARYLGLPLSTMKFKIDRLGIRSFERGFSGS